MTAEVNSISAGFKFLACLSFFDGLEDETTVSFDT